MSCHDLGPHDRTRDTKREDPRHHRSLLPGRPTLPKTGPGPHPHLRSYADFIGVKYSSALPVEPHDFMCGSQSGIFDLE